MDPQQIMSRLRALFGSFHPVQIASLVAAFIMVVAIIVGSAWWVNAPTYALLFSDMEPETAGEIVTRLKTMKVAYQLDEGGRVNGTVQTGDIPKAATAPVGHVQGGAQAGQNRL